MTLAAFEVPLTPEAQTLLIALGPATYSLNVYWNGASSCWMLDIRDPQANPIALGLPMVPGTDILGQLAYLGIPGELHLQVLGALAQSPGFADLGVDALLFFVTR